jgi:hypothetical protein
MSFPALSPLTDAGARANERQGINHAAVLVRPLRPRPEATPLGSRPTELDLHNAGASDDAVLPLTARAKQGGQRPLSEKLRADSRKKDRSISADGGREAGVELAPRFGKPTVQKKSSLFLILPENQR